MRKMRKRLRKWTERMRKVTVREKVVALNSGSLLAPACICLYSVHPTGHTLLGAGCGSGLNTHYPHCAMPRCYYHVPQDSDDLVS